jgi:hypothetical protein
MLPHWMRRWFKPSLPSRLGKRLPPPSKFRPVVERLEERSVPAVVNIAVVADAREGVVSTPGHALVSRTDDDLSQALTVRYGVSGTATPGVDYQALLGSVEIPAGQVSAPIVIQPIDDLIPELPEDVMVALAADPAYQLGEARQATVNIRNTETVTLIAGTNLTFFVGYTVPETTELPVVTAEVLPFGASFDIVHSEPHPPGAHTFGRFSWTPLLEQVGSHEVVFRVTVPGTDIDETSSLIIQVVPNFPPLVNVGGSSGTETDGQTQQFSWSAVDDVGLAFVSATVTQDGNPIFTSSDAAGSLNFDAYGPGNFGIAVTAIDTTSQLATASQFVTVNDDDPQGPIIVMGGSTGTESEAQLQEFTWDVSDDSGLSVLAVVIRQDTGSGPVEIYRTEDLDDAGGSFNFDSYGPGTFAVTVTATDGDNDRSGDGSESFATRSVSVTAGNSPPVLTVPGPFTVAEGQTLTFQVTANDPDIPPDTLSFGLIGGPAGAALDPVTGEFTWHPDCDAVGEYTVTFTVSDGRGGVDSEEVVLRATGVTAQARLGSTMARIENLVTGGILNRGQGQSLSAKLRAATRLLDLENGRAASVLLDSFDAQVDHLVGRGVLTSGQAATLETPSIIYWDGQGDGVSWNDPLNWSRDQLPEPCDDVYIQTRPNVTIMHEAGTVVIHSLHSSNALAFQGSLALAADSEVRANFALAGIMNVLQGAGLVLQGGGQLDGNFTLGQGARMDVVAGSYVLAAGTIVGGDGVFRAVASATLGLTVELTVTGAVTAQNFELGSRSTLQGAGTFIIGKRMNWTGGTMRGVLNTGLTIIRPGAEMVISGNVLIDNRVIRNDGTVNYNDGRLRMRQGIFENAGTFNVNDSLGIGQLGLPALGPILAQFRNLGTFNKAVSAGDCAVVVSFDNLGIVNINNGRLAFLGDGSHRGIFNVPPGTTLVFSDSRLAGINTLRAGTVFNGLGLVRVEDLGEVRIPANTLITIPNFELADGTLSVAGVFAAEEFAWTDRFARRPSIVGPGTVIVAPGKTLLMTGASGERLIDGTEIFNLGTIRWEGAHDLNLSNGAEIINDGSEGQGVFDIQNDQTINNSDGNIVISGILVRNNGLVEKTRTDGGLTTINTRFINESGVVDLNGHDIDFDQGYNQYGGQLRLEDATMTIALPPLIDGGTIDLGSNGTLVTAPLFVDTDVVLTGSGTIVGDLRNAGRIEIGGMGAAGFLNIQGDFTQDAPGVLNIEVGGQQAAQIDRLTVIGLATLGGTLNAALINNFTPAIGQTFAFMSFVGSAGSFAARNLQLGAGLFFSLLATQTELTFATNVA